MAATAASTVSDFSDLGFATYFADVNDPCTQRSKEHKLLDIIGLTICAVVAEADGFVGIERFGESRREWLKQFWELKNEIHPTTQ